MDTGGAAAEPIAPRRVRSEERLVMFKGFQKPKRLVANTETLTDRYGMFTAQPFERGLVPRSAIACGECS